MAAQAEVIEVKKLNMQRINVEIEGTEPGLLVNRFSEKARRKIEKDQAKGGGRKKTKTPRDPGQDVEDARYKLDPPRDGSKDGIPAVSFKQAMVRAGYHVGGHKMTELRTMFWVEGGPDELIPIREKSHTRHDDQGRGGQTLHLIYRPHYAAGWKATIPIDFNADMITPEALVNMLEAAGRCIGVGCKRPEKGHNNGRFQVVTSGAAEAE